MIDEKFIKPGAIVIDVGINRLESKNNDNSSNKEYLLVMSNLKSFKNCQKNYPCSWWSWANDNCMLNA